MVIVVDIAKTRAVMLCVDCHCRIFLLLSTHVVLNGSSVSDGRSTRLHQYHSPAQDSSTCLTIRPRKQRSLLIRRLD